MVLRLFLGFPLKNVDKEFLEFLFNPCLEYARYCLHLTIGFCAQGILSFLMIRNGNNPNPFSVAQEVFNRMGLSLLDMCVIGFFPIVTYISCFFYISSFQKSVKNTNEICGMLACLNTDLTEAHCSHAKEQRNPKIRTMSLVFWGVAISLFALICLTCAGFFQVMEGMFPEEYVQKADVIPYGIANSLWCLTWIYPGIAISADIFICHLLETLDESFKNWNHIFKGKRCDDDDDDANTASMKLYIKANCKIKPFNIR